MPPINERRIVTGAAAALVAWGGTQYGIVKMIPALGPVGAPIVTIIAGAVLALYGKEGTLGAAIEGAGYGLVVVGALELAGS